MKKLLSMLAGIVLIASLATVANAQAAGPTGGGVQSTTSQGAKGKAGGPIGAKILKQLDLTPDQMKQVRQLGMTFQQKRQQLVQAGNGTPNKKDLAALRKEFLQDLGKILTPGQRDKLKELIAARRKQNQNGKGIGTGTGTGTGTGNGTGTGTGTGG